MSGYLGHSHKHRLRYARLEQIITSCLEDLSFKKRGARWVRFIGDIAQVVSLVRDRYGLQYHVEIGVQVFTDGPAVLPKDHSLDVRWAGFAVHMSAKERSLWIDATNLDCAFLGEKKVDRIVRKVIQKYVRPQLEQCVSRRSLCTFLRNAPRRLRPLYEFGVLNPT